MPLAPHARARLHASLGAAGAWLIAWRIENPITLALAGAATLLALLAWIAPRAFAPVQRTLDAFTRALLAALTWLLLGIVFFGVLVPLRAWRLLRRRSAPPSADSPAGFLLACPPARPGRFLRQF